MINFMSYFYTIFIDGSVLVAEKVPEYYVPVIVKALMQEFYAEQGLNISIKRICNKGDDDV